MQSRRTASLLAAAAALAAIVATLAAPRAARADATGALTPGVTYAHSWGRSPTDGVGLQLAYTLHPDARRWLYAGVVSQAQLDTDGSWRFAGALRVGVALVGLDIGL